MEGSILHDCSFERRWVFKFSDKLIWQLLNPCWCIVDHLIWQLQHAPKARSKLFLAFKVIYRFSQLFLYSFERFSVPFRPRLYIVQHFQITRGHFCVQLLCRLWQYCTSFDCFGWLLCFQSSFVLLVSGNQWWRPMHFEGLMMKRLIMLMLWCKQI